MQKPLSTRRAAHWQLPEGVSRGLWEYTQSDIVAEDYDEYFAFNSLFGFDEAVLAEHFQPLGTVADLGCGTGRALLPLIKQGHQGLAVDLSTAMLEVVREKADLSDLNVQLVRANLVELDCLPDACVNYAMCMFSTLGMIRGRANRQQALAHARRILKPGGRFVLHVHNVWSNLRDGGGRAWLLPHLMEAARKKDVELGDKFFDYRGVHNMFLHVFAQRELVADLRGAGFRLVELIPLNIERRHRLRAAWLLPRLRANGWIVVCAAD